MLLDIRTLIFVLTVSNALIFILIGSTFISRRRDTGGVSCWLWSYAVQTLGWALLLLRGIAPDWLSIVVANTLLISGAVLVFRAIRDFLERPITWHISILTILLFLTVFSGLYASGSRPTTLVIWVSLMGGALGLACAMALMKDIQWRSAPARWTTGLWLGVSGAILIARAIAVFLSPTPNYSLYTQSIVQIIAFIVAYSAMLGASFGFNLMLQERTTHTLQQIAQQDELTGVFNRRYLLDRVKHELSRMRRRNSDNLVLMMLDIDNFKVVNDQYGHAAGDALLKSFTAQLSEILRTPDVLGRYGGEEFCVLLPDTNLEKGLQVAERLRMAAKNARISVGNEILQRTVSIGVAHASGNALPELDKLFLAADRALYQAKQDGRDRIACAVDTSTTYEISSPFNTINI
ncbi:MAG TPA: GGDEF domain-containing protein [Burkholderiaceae bacterium]|jgi:diguanylate cyclase (GGDEF)-like protein